MTNNLIKHSFWKIQSLTILSMTIFASVSATTTSIEKIDLPCLEPANHHLVPVHYCCPLSQKSNQDHFRGDVDKDKKGWNATLTQENMVVRAANPLDEVTYQHTLDQIQRYSNGKNEIFLEVGSSAGRLIQKMIGHIDASTHLIGSDFIEENCARLAKQFPGIPFVCFDLVNCHLKKESIDLVVSLHVLEHIKEDELAVESIYNLLKPGGIAVIEVPAGSGTYDISDAYYLHYRSYDIEQLCNLFQNAGFEVLERNHLGVLDYPLHWLKKKWGRYQHGITQYREDYTEEQRQEQKRIVHERLQKDVSTSTFNLLNLATFKKFVYRIESWMRNFISFPVGARCSITCRKKNS